MKNVLVVFGTRPEAIKMAPLINEFKRNDTSFKVKICVTAQHREMLDQVLDFFNIKSDYDLNLMKPGQNLYDLTAVIISKMKDVLEDSNPDFVFVHGDTTTSMAAALAAFYYGAKICHVEAGLRTNNKLSPFPEEINRQLVGRICDYHFAPTTNSMNNLMLENIDEKNIIITGNTVIDALISSLEKIEKNTSQFVDEFSEKVNNKEIILVTGHRRENHGKGFNEICAALKRIALDNPEIVIVYPVHLNPKVQEPVLRLLAAVSNIILIKPLSYPDFIWLMNRSKIILTDSGGIQEEAPSLGKPVLVLRDTTERPEAIIAGTVILVGTDQDLICKTTNSLLKDSVLYEKMSGLHNPYGDGNASRKIVDFLKTI